MRYLSPCLVGLFVALSGCASNTKPAGGVGDRAAPDAAEAVVRAVLADLLKIEPAAIPMDRPIGEPPLRADELDLVEVIMELEERQGVEISDAAVERYAGGKLGSGPIRITPDQLASIVRDAPKLRQSRRPK